MKTLDLRDSEMRCEELERDVESSYKKVAYVHIISIIDCSFISFIFVLLMYGEKNNFSLPFFAL